MSWKRLFKLNWFPKPAKFREVVSNASQSFWLATSRIKEKYNLSFAQACEFLEDKGYLRWAGDTPIYDIGSDKLWKEDTVRGKRKFDISRFSGPGEFRKAVPFVSTSFCHATSKIMEKHNLTFAKTCEFLEKAGYLDWADTTPIYNLAGDKLWMEETIEKPSEIAAPEKEPTSIHTTDTGISCHFFTLAVRNGALEANYSGGLKAFVKRHYSKYNKDLTVLVAMAAQYLNEAIEDIVDQGLVRGDDFHTFDAMFIDFIEDDEKVVDQNAEGYYFRVDDLPWDKRAEWLQGYVHDNKLYVRIVKDTDS
jgi:hypothetical protein